MDQITVAPEDVIMKHDLPALIETSMRNGDLFLEVYAVSPSGAFVPVGDLMKLDWPVVIRPVVKSDGKSDGKSVISND